MPKILYPEKMAELTLKTVAGAMVSPGDLLGYSAGWLKADESTPIYAQWVALQGGRGGETIKVCKKCVLTEGTYTADTAQYLSTAGGITETRPTGNAEMIQRVGGSIDTTRAIIDIKDPYEWEMFLSPDAKDTSGEPGLGVADAGWPGPSLTGLEGCYFKGRLPSGLIGGNPITARLIGNSINASAGDIDVTVVGAYDGTAATPSANNEDTGTAITAGDWVQADADNKILWLDVSACFDTDFYKPMRNFAVFVDPDGITGDLQIIGLYLRGWRV